MFSVIGLVIPSFIQSITADHLEPGTGIFKNENQVNTILSKDSKYEILAKKFQILKEIKIEVLDG